jgi:hypothetical protein
MSLLLWAFWSKSWPLGGYTLGTGRHFHTQILATPASIATNAATSAVQNLVVKMVTNNQGVST